MKRWKKMMIGSIVLGMSLVFGACGNQEGSSGESANEITVSTWNYETTPEFKALFEAFEKKTGIKVKAVDIASDDYDTKLTTMLSSGDTTDVLTMKNLLSYSNYALRDQLVDQTERIRELDTAAEGTYEMYDIDGKTYALPYRTDFWVLYYNKKMFDDAGIEYPENLTWDEYEDLAKKLSKNDGQVYGAYQHIWRSTIQAIAAAQNEANLVEPDYRFMADYYDRALRMQKEGAQMDFGTAKSTKVTYQSQFEEQKAAMMYMGTWYMAGILANKEANKTEVEWGITAIPQKKKGESVTTFGSPTAFAVNKNSKKQKAAQEFIEFAASEEGAKVLAGVGVVPSYRTDEIDQLYFNLAGMPTDEISKKAFSPDEIKLEFPIDTHGPAIDKILQEEHDLILVGDETPEKGTANMEKRVAAEKE
ncbi:TPA: ABC transporter substrate-binding protein [Enterococcus faecium]|uniref:ABC transporter substrate-binding protein n=1 Tax=Enterococcus TaxID=1350 RepID=UPI0002A38923|nr:MULTISPECIES: sugar ABC transporter substrate-binding protein [Enterococcus]ELA82535.1 sugar ABC transporter sugar-binding protein [Enterococcus faecium EnGen0004]EPI08490.1 ABC transporter, solute-binding protein [Enterococcus faecium SD3B-2]MDP8000687.1 sugar ABC transporter substrate-binding protein [Enterococcus faecium]MEB4619901.1 sugar ABC transporter substrate-binding protein [Enterococcus sp. E4-223]MEB7311903.1 sugar ABC transporter substrate-binding protein [Enterococcus faecium]